MCATPSPRFPGPLRISACGAEPARPNTIRGSWNLIQTFSPSLRDPPAPASRRLRFHVPAAFATSSSAATATTCRELEDRGPGSSLRWWNNTNLAAKPQRPAGVESRHTVELKDVEIMSNEIKQRKQIF